MGLLAFNAQPLHAGILEIEAALPVESSSVAVTWAFGFPDTSADTDTRAILESLAPGKGPPLLPRGRLSPSEETFLAGLRAVMDGKVREAAERWDRLRPQSLPSALHGNLRVNAGVLLALRGETAAAEENWLREWREQGAAREAAWRNLLALRLAQNRVRDAESLLEDVLAKDPRHRLALLAKAAFIRQFRAPAEWESYLREQASAEDASPDMQLAYGELLTDRGRYEEAVRMLDRGLAERPGAGHGWFQLARAQYRLGYYYFAIDCLQNAGRAGYQSPDFYELYARVLHACCTDDEDARAVRARAAAEELLEKGLEKDLHRRSMAQLLYHLYCLNGKPDAAKTLERDLWFHFEGPRRDVPGLGDPVWPRTDPGARELRVKPGIYSLTWVLALRESDVYRAD